MVLLFLFLSKLLPLLIYPLGLVCMLLAVALGCIVTPAPTDFHVVRDPLNLDNNTWQGRTLSLVPQTDPLYYLTRALKEYLGIAVYWFRGWL